MIYKLVSEFDESLIEIEAEDEYYAIDKATNIMQNKDYPMRITESTYRVWDEKMSYLVYSGVVLSNAMGYFSGRMMAVTYINKPFKYNRNNFFDGDGNYLGEDVYGIGVILYLKGNQVKEIWYKQHTDDEVCLDCGRGPKKLICNVCGFPDWITDCGHIDNVKRITKSLCKYCDTVSIAYGNVPDEYVLKPFGTKWCL